MVTRALRVLGVAAAAACCATVVPRAAMADPPPPPPRLEGQHFTIDPVSDGLLIVGGAGFSGLLGLVLSTGEIAPSKPGDESNLLSFDRTAISQTIDKNAATYSTIGLWTAVGYAVLDPVLSGFRDGWDAALVDAVMYAESLSLTEMLTDITKIAVRRPRPIDYINGCGATPTPTTGCSSTDMELSFFSGHASTTAAVTATATYLAFSRSGPRSVRPWLTLGLGTALTGFVSYERVRSGNHFPTDVIAGSMAGAAVGILVPHLHRHQEEAPPVWVGAAPAPGGGGSLTLGGVF